MPQAYTYEELAFREIKKLKKQVDILLVTVNEHESEALHRLIKPMPDKDVILKASNDMLTYSIGVLGKYIVCHVESKMGSATMGGSLMTMQQSLADWNPKIIVMVGIAFGKDKKAQQIGDVLISHHIIQYQHIKINKKGEIEARGDQHHCGLRLLDRFKSYRGGWHYPISGSTPSTVRIGDLLSGDVLIDYEPYRNDLLKKFRTAIGGEMEGTGVSNIAIAKRKEWIIVKGICDFADGNKGRFKERNQKIAAAAAASFCKSIFNHTYVFDCFSIKALPEITETLKPQEIQAADVVQEIPLEKVIIPKIPGLTDNDMQANRKLIRAFLSLTVSSRFHIGTLLGLVDPEEIENGNNEEVSTQILVRAKEQNLFGQLWSTLFDEKNDPNPFK